MLGPALIQWPDVLWVIYRFLKKVIKNQTTPVSDESNVPAQKDIELASISTQADGVEANASEDYANVTHFKTIIMNKFAKLDESIGKLIQTIHEISLKQQYHDQLINDNGRKGKSTEKNSTRRNL